MNRPKRYEIFSEMNADNFFEFIIDLFDNMGMNRPNHDMKLPIDCSYCPLRKECQAYGDDETTCLEFLLTKLK